MEDSDPTDAGSLKSWLRCHGFDRNRADVTCANGHTVHVTQLVNEYLNGNAEHDGPRAKGLAAPEAWNSPSLS